MHNMSLRKKETQKQYLKKQWSKIPTIRKYT